MANLLVRCNNFSIGNILAEPKAYRQAEPE